MGRLGHTLSTLRPGGRPTGRKTRFRLLARLYRVGSLSHWVPPKGFLDASYIAFLLSQAFPGASALRSAPLQRDTHFCQSASDTSTTVGKPMYVARLGPAHRGRCGCDKQPWERRKGCNEYISKS